MSFAEVQISAEALRRNVTALGKLAAPGVQIAAVVKANAYGHGLEQVVPVVEPLVDAFQVDDVDELVALRQVSKARALVFGYLAEDEIGEALSLDAEITIYDRDRLDTLCREAKRRGRRARVHLKVDALLGRLGVIHSQLDDLLIELQDRPEIEVVASYAHYANIEDTSDPEHVLAQESAFEACFRKVRAAFPEAQRHFSATSGLMTREGPAAKNALVRIGIGMYGLYPSGPLATAHAALQLRPAMRWVAQLAQVKLLPAGHPVGYGLTYVTQAPSRIGIVPQGYADGYDRGLSNCGEVLVAGKRCPVIGRVAMNMFMVDLSAAPAANQGDEVVLLGSQGSEAITAEEIAEKLGTINYEVVSRVSPHLRRSAAN